MRLISKYNKGIRFFSKYALVVPLKEFCRKIWIDKGNEFYNKSMKKKLQDNYIEIYSTYNEEKSAVAEKFIGTLKNKIYKCLTIKSKSETI